jgi:hypothetical protein
MRRALVLCACLVLFPAVLAAAGDVNSPENPEVAVLAAAGDGNSPESPEVAVMAAAGDVKSEMQSGAKELSGMSIVGNDEAPKSLYIVPWKSSEIGAETSLDTMLDEGDVPVDRDVFKRQLGFYRVSTGK